MPLSNDFTFNAKKTVLKNIESLQKVIKSAKFTDESIYKKEDRKEAFTALFAMRMAVDAQRGKKDSLKSEVTQEQYEAQVKKLKESPSFSLFLEKQGDEALQRKLTEGRTHGGSTEDAFKEFRYLLDFYSLQCDYNRIADRMYQVAGLMRQEGKEIMFIRFANTVDVRRAYEACVLHAPGASWVPEAMLIIGALREDEGKYEEAVKVYENLRNTHREAPESALALMREADARMRVLRERAYNRARSRETADFLSTALRTCKPGDAEVLKEYLAEVRALMEDEAYRGARFYDSPTRTVRSAVNAYERFLAEYPDSVRAEEVRARLDELKGAVK